MRKNTGYLIYIPLLTTATGDEVNTLVSIGLELESLWNQKVEHHVTYSHICEEHLHTYLVISEVECKDTIE